MSDNQNRRKFEAKLISQTWKDKAFKQKLINNPKAVYEAELGQKLPKDHEVKVLEESSDITYLVIPQKQKKLEELFADMLKSIVSGFGFDSIIPLFELFN